MKVLDLFSGIGGFSLGLESAGFETVAFCEYEEHGQKILKRHWPGVPVYKDVRELTYEKLKADGVDTIDVITGGFPCQDLSSAGKRAGIYGERSGLWGELYRLACEIRPKYLIFENVTGLLTGEGGRWFDRLLSDLAEGGFNAEWECVPASSIGAPHHRDRVYGIAYPSEVGWLGIYSQANFKIRRNLGNNNEPYWFGTGEGHWSNWKEKVTGLFCSQPLISRADDGVSDWMDRNSRLGNSIVPQIAGEIGKAILLAEGHAPRKL